MKIGYMVMGGTVPDALANARILEAAGAAGAWVGEAAIDAFAWTAAMAAVTSTVTVGTAVALLTRPPVQAVLAATAIDELAPGRFRLGLGVGPAQRNRDWFALDPAHPARRMRAYLGAFQAAWRATPGSPAEVSDGPYPIHGFARRRRSPTPALPLHVGVIGPLNTALAAELTRGPILDVALPLDHVDRVTLPALEAGLARAGRQRADIEVGAVLALSVDRDAAAARRRARHLLLTYAAVDYYAGPWTTAGFGTALARCHDALAAGSVEAALEAIPDEMVDALTLSGTPDQVRARLPAWASRVDFAIVATPALLLPPDEVQYAWRAALDALGGAL